MSSLPSVFDLHACQQFIYFHFVFCLIFHRTLRHRYMFWMSRHHSTKELRTNRGQDQLCMANFVAKPNSLSVTLVPLIIIIYVVLTIQESESVFHCPGCNRQFHSLCSAANGDFIGIARSPSLPNCPLCVSCGMNAV